MYTSNWHSLPFRIAEVKGGQRGQCVDSAVILALHATQRPAGFRLCKSQEGSVDLEAWHECLAWIGGSVVDLRGIPTRPLIIDEDHHWRRGDQALTPPAVRRLLDKLGGDQALTPPAVAIVTLAKSSKQAMRSTSKAQGGYRQLLSYLLTPHGFDNCAIREDYPVVLLWKPPDEKHVMLILTNDHHDQDHDWTVKALGCDDAAMWLMRRGVQCPWAERRVCSPTKKAIGPMGGVDRASWGRAAHNLQVTLPEGTSLPLPGPSPPCSPPGSVISFGDGTEGLESFSLSDITFGGRETVSTTSAIPRAEAQSCRRASATTDGLTMDSRMRGLKLGEAETCTLERIEGGSPRHFSRMATVTPDSEKNRTSFRQLLQAGVDSAGVERDSNYSACTREHGHKMGQDPDSEKVTTQQSQLDLQRQVAEYDPTNVIHGVTQRVQKHCVGTPESMDYFGHEPKVDQDHGDTKETERGWQTLPVAGLSGRPRGMEQSSKYVRDLPPAQRLHASTEGSAQRPKSPLEDKVRQEDGPHRSAADSPEVIDSEIMSDWIHKLARITGMQLSKTQELLLGTSQAIQSQSIASLREKHTHTMDVPAARRISTGGPLTRVYVQDYDASTELFSIWSSEEGEVDDVPSTQIFAIGLLAPADKNEDAPLRAPRVVLEAENALRKQLCNLDTRNGLLDIGYLKCGVLMIEHAHALQTLAFSHPEVPNQALRNALVLFAAEVKDKIADIDGLIHLLRGLPTALLPSSVNPRGCVNGLDQLDQIAGTLQRAWKQIENNEMLRQVQLLGKILSDIDFNFKPRTQREKDYAKGREKVYRARIQRTCAGIETTLPTGRKLIQDSQAWCSRHLDLDDGKLLEYHGIARKHPHHSFLLTTLASDRSNLLVDFDGTAVPTAVILVCANTDGRRHHTDEHPFEVAEVMHAVCGEKCDAALLVALNAARSPGDIQLIRRQAGKTPTLVYHPGLRLTTPSGNVRTGEGRYLWTRPLKRHNTFVERGRPLDFTAIRVLLNELECAAVVVLCKAPEEKHPHGRYVSYLITPSSFYDNRRRVREASIPLSYKVVLLWTSWSYGLQDLMLILNARHCDDQIPKALPAAEAALYLMGKGVSCPWVQGFNCSIYPLKQAPPCKFDPPRGLRNVMKCKQSLPFELTEAWRKDAEGVPCSEGCADVPLMKGKAPRKDTAFPK